MSPRTKRPSPALIYAVLLLLGFILVRAATPPSYQPSKPSRTTPRLQPKRKPPAPRFAQGLAPGATIWVNMWHYPSVSAQDYCRKLKQHGVRNIILQTSRSNTEAVVDSNALADLIDAAHAEDMRVFAWSFATLQDPEADAQKLVDAAFFRTATKHGVDGVVANLEQNLEQWRVEKYCRRLRAKLGATYPAIACVYSPVCRNLEAKRTPWKLLASNFQIIAPMVYWNSSWSKYDARQYTLLTAQLARKLAGPKVRLHMVGDGMGTKEAAIVKFLQACREVNADSASVYPDGRVSADTYRALKRYERIMHRP